MNANNSSAANVVKSLRNPYLQVSDQSGVIDPLSCAFTMNMMYDRYQKPLFLVENGLAQKMNLLPMARLTITIASAIYANISAQGRSDCRWHSADGLHHMGLY
ncbi:hypothetical protein ACLK2A_14810 [Escherichia coli]